MSSSITEPTNLTLIKIDPAKLLKARGTRKQAEVARQVGLKSRQQLWNYEHGLFDVPVDVLARLCRLYGCGIEDLITEGG